MRGSAAVVAALSAVMAFGSTQAEADIGPVQLVSKNSLEQADEASETALSGDGMFLAFQGSIGGQEGIFREEIATGAIIPVATGGAYERGAPRSDAEEPSISADGRYVSFTTAAPLDPVADEAAAAGGTALDDDVYVADLATSPPTYELASARDGSSEGLGYAEVAGAAASGRVALSADGRVVVFYTRSASDLTGPAGETLTESGQIAVRNLATKTTTLVSVERNPSTGQMEPDTPVPGGVFRDGLHEGASLSANGSTVAWLSVHLPGQVPLLPEEQTAIEADEGQQEHHYDEPLWRRIADGPTTPTRRIIGGGDPTAPGCPSPGSFAIEACRGPYPEMDTGTSVPQGRNTNMGWLGTPDVTGLPLLSADGQTVALLANPVVQESDLFIVSMGEGLSRRQAVKQWTFEAPSLSAEADLNNIPLDGDIYDAAIDAAGNRVAFTTGRQQFPGGVTNLVGSPPTALGLREVYLLDLETGALQRVTHGSSGTLEPSLPGKKSIESALQGGASSVSLDDDDGMLAFSSNAANLVQGDANGASDAFVDDVAEPPSTVGRSQISPVPSFAIRKARRQMTLTARSLPGGRVRLVAVVPGPGSVKADAAASLVVGKPARKVSKTRARSRRGGVVRLTLGLSRRLRRLSHSSTGLFATAHVSFRGPGGGPLRDKLEVHFHAHQRRPKKGRAKR